MEKTRAALFLPNLGGGGAERITLNLAEQLVSEGVQVDLVVAKGEGDLLSQVPNTVTLVDLGASWYVTSTFPLVRYLIGARPDVLLSALPVANCIAVWSCFLARFSGHLVLGNHGAIQSGIAASSLLRKKVLFRLMKWAYPRADHIAVSQGVGDDIATTFNLPRNKIDVIYNPVITPDVRANMQKAVHHPWLQPGQPPVVLGVGRLTAQKDYPTLLRAFAELRKLKDVRLIILGEGKDRDSLEALARQLGIASDIEMPGFVANPLPYIKAASVFALSSRWEGLPTVLIEALACGTPIVSTDCPSGPSEVLENGVWGQLVPMGDVQALSDGIANAMCQERDVGIARAEKFNVKNATLGYMKVLGISG